MNGFCANKNPLTSATYNLWFCLSLTSTVITYSRPVSKTHTPPGNIENPKTKIRKILRSSNRGQ